jgi:cob(I)alamin adenosyltransferase
MPYESNQFASLTLALSILFFDHMTNRLTHITTRTGDDGTTALADGQRLTKDDLRFAAMGDVDELNVHLGLLATSIFNIQSEYAGDESVKELVGQLQAQLKSQIHAIQHDLFDLGSELAIPGYVCLTEQRLQALESWTAEANKGLPPLQEFILPGGSAAAAQAHVVRVVCRRAERSMVALKQREPIHETSLQFLNRLSDWAFVTARLLNQQLGVVELFWVAPKHR